MIKTDEDALECDLAETYRIYDYRELPPMRVALFAIGLSNDARIKRAISGMKIPMDTFLLASITDYLSWLVWSKTKDGQNGKNKPRSIVDILNGKDEEENQKFVSGDDFEAMWQQLASSEEKGG